MLIVTEENLTAGSVFAFTIETTGGKISVKPTVATGGLYDGGHARIHNRGKGARSIEWASADAFTLEFAELGPSDGDADGDVTDLFKRIEVRQDGKWVKGTLRKGSGWETIAYKYTVTVGAVSLDPLIIVDR